MVDLKTLKQLIRLMADNGLAELDLRDKDGQITLKRGGGGVVQPVVAYAPPHQAPGAAASHTPTATAPVAAPAGDENAGLTKVTSPMVGTFYAAQSPDAQPFVKVGAHVGPDSVVCIIEAMKVFNEIKAECAGTIAKVLVNSGQAVEFGQPLYLVKPD